ncbi:MAG: hypothetical protein HFI70_01230 [Lachnospiraceae bacterium]|nr:hypothetical protein [Lachnospiraceae bacterium]
MACFVVPAAEAVVTTVVHKVITAKEKKKGAAIVSGENGVVKSEKLSFSHKLKWLNNMLWGGSALLAFEHIWHGEVTPWFPFLSAANSASDTAEMLHEMSTTGVAMAVLVTGVWLGMTVISSVIEKRPVQEMEGKKGELS